MRAPGPNPQPAATMMTNHFVYRPVDLIKWNTVYLRGDGICLNDRMSILLAVLLRQDPPPPWFEFLAIFDFFAPWYRRIIKESFGENRFKNSKGKLTKGSRTLEVFCDHFQPRSRRRSAAAQRAAIKIDAGKVPRSQKAHTAAVLTMYAISTLAIYVACSPHDRVLLYAWTLALALVLAKDLYKYCCWRLSFHSFSNLSEGRSTTVFVASVVQSWSVESVVMGRKGGPRPTRTGCRRSTLTRPGIR